MIERVFVLFRRAMTSFLYCTTLTISFQNRPCLMQRVGMRQFLELVPVYHSSIGVQANFAFGDRLYDLGQ